MSNIKSQSTSSSVSSRKFNLNEQDTGEILVYRLRHGYTISSQRDLCKELDNSKSSSSTASSDHPQAQEQCEGHTDLLSRVQTNAAKVTSTDPKLRCSRKFIPRGSSRVDVKTQDLFNEPERTQYSKHPNARLSLASVGLPRKVYWKRLLMGHFQNLYIVSPDHSPNSSADGSEESSPAATATGLPAEGTQPWSTS